MWDIGSEHMVNANKKEVELESNSLTQRDTDFRGGFTLGFITCGASMLASYSAFKMSQYAIKEGTELLPKVVSFLRKMPK